MKIKLLLLILISNINSSFSQTVLDTDGLNNLNNVYLFTLKEYCKSLDSTKFKVVYVRDEHFIGESWPKKIMGFEIKYLENESDYLSAIWQNGGRATIVGITPFDFRKGEFSCGIIPFAATYKDNNINMSNGGGLTVYFTYYSRLKGLVYKSKKWTGI